MQIFDKIEAASTKNLILSVNEQRVELYDDRINLMGLSEPKEINYFNVDSTIREGFKQFGADIEVSIVLSPKVFI